MKCNEMNNFIKHFSKYNWNLEFIQNNNWDITKSLFYFKNNDNLIILKYLENIFWVNEKIIQIFNLYWIKINHIWFDESNNRYKFYISLYNEVFEKSLKIIKICKDILWIKESYHLEKDFFKFDCIWFDISEKWINMKIYEIVRNNNNFDLLPDFIKKEYVKEIGYLKSFSWRKKKFFRFKEPLEILLFYNIFDISKINILQKEIMILSSELIVLQIEWYVEETPGSYWYRIS